ncbi:hypothetical protein F7725_027586 [Dissostichus mawsoni]|uniref:RING-type domain-containing protein n=1 Tax=Dissostichus mawsoni TaxID=36200 RepID=A0A7J5XFM4_DISMA|nr:hypothetical protein F7725_027586 [Dissostichus mawsoni]
MLCLVQPCTPTTALNPVADMQYFMRLYHCRHVVSRCSLDRLSSEGPAGNGHLRSSRSLLSTPEQPALQLMCHHMESTLSCPSISRDSHCPVCLQTASFPVQTNCGHLFCAPCLIAYWRHGSWLDAISCPLCRQKVSVLCNLFNESRSDSQSKEVLGEITDYNRAILEPQEGSLGTMGGLVWLFFFRVALCCVGTVVSISYPPLDPVSSSSSANPLGTDPSLFGLLGVLDDLVVVILLLICIININQHMAPERGGQSATRSQGAAAFLNMRSHGEGVREGLKSLGAQGHCHPRVQRSGWGIMARCLPSLEQSPATPRGEPFGFRGYSSVG